MNGINVVSILLWKSSYSYDYYNHNIECKEANKLMPNKNTETEKEEKRRCGRLCPDCPMKNDDEK
ncbi:hypothetical protein METP3_01875 [Methanosarcinales archaeon]|nr:hypothetical protein METP3_01875 [Methanosarcinales archaeon]